MTIYDKIYTLTNISLEKFFTDIVNFYDNEYYLIFKYYTEYSQTYPKEAFETYNNLKQRTIELIAKILSYKNSFESIAYWNLLEQLDEIKEKLELITNYPKFFCINFFKEQNQTKNYDIYTTKQHETLEQIAKKFNQDASDIAIQNNLTEDSYTLKGGIPLILKSPKIESEDTDIAYSIVDIQLGENLLGKDFPNYISFSDESGDITVMTPKETFVQSIINLCSLYKGAIPEYPSLGIEKSLTQTTRYDIQNLMPIILRQLSETISVDDTIYKFQIDNIERVPNSDIYKLYISVQNRLGEDINITKDF